MSTDRRLGRTTFPLIFAAPSGAGKTTIARALAERRGDVDFSVSATTRAPRGYERDGVDYHFTDEPGFRRMIDADELLEWAQVHGHYYGTPRRNLEEARSAGRFLILDIDIQGSRQVREAAPEAVSIFVLPPSGRELARRLAGRGSEPVAVQRRRLENARGELTAATEFDYVIVNDDLDASVAAVDAIVRAESYRPSRAPRLRDRLESMVAEVDECLHALRDAGELESQSEEAKR